MDLPEAAFGFFHDFLVTPSYYIMLESPSACCLFLCAFVWVEYPDGMQRGWRQDMGWRPAALHVSLPPRYQHHRLHDPSSSASGLAEDGGQGTCWARLAPQPDTHLPSFLYLPPP